MCVFAQTNNNHIPLEELNKMLTASSSRVDRKVKARDSSVSTCCGSSPVDQQQRLSNMRNLVKNFPGAALKSPPSSSLSPNNEELSEASAVAAEKRRKAAAAAARKRRRKIYSARRRTNKTLRSTSQVGSCLLCRILYMLVALLTAFIICVKTAATTTASSFIQWSFFVH